LLGAGAVHHIRLGLSAMPDQCPVYPRKRPCSRHSGSAGSCQTRTSVRLVDHLVGAMLRPSAFAALRSMIGWNFSRQRHKQVRGPYFLEKPAGEDAGYVRGADYLVRLWYGLASLAASPPRDSVAASEGPMECPKNSPKGPPCPVASANASADSPPVRAAAVAKTIMILRNIGITSSDATGAIRVKIQSRPSTQITGIIFSATLGRNACRDSGVLA
jgi:hypothetical protein